MNIKVFEYNNLSPYTSITGRSKTCLASYVFILKCLNKSLKAVTDIERPITFDRQTRSI